MIRRWIFELLLWWVACRRKPDFTIGPFDSPYLRRWWVIPRNKWFNIYLHQILHDDDDEALHDHPWHNVSWLLHGRYIEVVPWALGPDGTRPLPRKEGSWVFRRATAAHRLVLEKYNTTVYPCWTLFFTGPVIRDWGFHCPNGWRYFKDYVKLRDDGTGTVKGRGCGEMTP